MNPDTTSPTSDESPVPRTRCWWQFAGCSLLLLFLAFLSTYGYVRLATHVAWQKAMEEASLHDPRWQLMDIEADRVSIADKDNAALHIMAITSKTKDFRVSYARDYYKMGSPQLLLVSSMLMHTQGSPFAGISALWLASSPRIAENYYRMLGKLPPTAQLNAQQVQFISGELAKVAGLLQEARKLKEMPNGRYPVTYTDDFMHTLVSEQSNSRNLTDWLEHDAYLLAQEKQIDEAMQSCRAILNVGRAMGDEPSLISNLIRFDTQRIAVETLERVLAQGKASPVELQAMQDLLNKEIKESGWLTGIRGKRAGYHYLFENLRSGKVKMLNFRKLERGIIETDPDWVTATFPWTVLWQYPESLHCMNQAVEIARLPIHERGRKIAEWTAEVKATKNQVIRSLAPALMKTHVRECRSQALLRSALVALACERYRLEHKEWPASLDILVREKLLHEVPTDPIDGQPLRCRHHEDYMVIYSIGPDHQDNQGHIDRENSNLPGQDVGFRLWVDRARRQPPLPVIAGRRQ